MMILNASDRGALLSEERKEESKTGIEGRRQFFDVWV